jgi:sortase A
MPAGSTRATRAAARAVSLSAACALVLPGCSQGPAADLAEGRDRSAGVAGPLPQSPTGTGGSPGHPPRAASRPPATSAPRTTGAAQGTLARRIHLSVPELGLERLRVVPYDGTADDRPGTVIQDRGLAATPRGPRGGVGPGQVGNFIATGHRTTHGRSFGDLPSLRGGAHVLVTAGGRVYDYRITRTLRVSFRDHESRMSQSAPVPGRPGEPATDAWITLSTCATPEDHAAGNYWSDRLGNPEHRIDKVGRLVDVRPGR